jgi:branched-chain amino acid transport system substrate-binding protein
MRSLLWMPLLLALLFAATLTPAAPVGAAHTPTSAPPATAAHTPAPILVGAVYPLSGPQGAGGQDELGGVQTALALVNADGGISGRPVRLAVKDAPTPAAGVAAVDSLVLQDHVPVILGSYSSVVAVAASAEANRLHTIWWETGAVADAVTAHQLPDVFRTVAAGSNLGRTSAQFTLDTLLPAWRIAPERARIALVYEDDSYGSSVAAGAAAEAAAAGLPVVARIAYSVTNVDPTAIARQIGAARPDVLWDASYLNDGIAIWRAIAASGVALKGAVGTSSAFCMPAFGQALGPLATGLFASDKADASVNPAALTPATRAVLARATAWYAARHHGGMDLSAIAGFVGAWALLHDVAPQAGAWDAAGIRAAALAVNLPNGSEVNGAGLRFAPSTAPDAGQNVRAANVVWQWQPQGQVVVYPQPYATTPLIVTVPQASALAAR